MVADVHTAFLVNRSGSVLTRAPLCVRVRVRVCVQVHGRLWTIKLEREKGNEKKSPGYFIVAAIFRIVHSENAECLGNKIIKVAILSRFFSPPCILPF